MPQTLPSQQMLSYESACKSTSLFLFLGRKKAALHGRLFHITSVFIFAIRNNCRQDVVKDFMDVNMDTDILPQITGPTLKESFHQAVS